MDADLDALTTALYVTTEDLLKQHPERVPPRPKVGFVPRIGDAEVLTLAVMQALLGFTSERRWLRHARTHLLAMFPDLPGQSGYNKRLRALAPTMAWLTTRLAAMTSIGDDTTWVADSTPVECGRSRETASVRIWPGGPSTATAPHTPAIFGDYGCIWCARCTGCPPGGH